MLIHNKKAKFTVETRSRYYSEDFCEKVIRAFPAVELKLAYSILVFALTFPIKMAVRPAECKIENQLSHADQKFHYDRGTIYWHLLQVLTCGAGGQRFAPRP